MRVCVQEEHARHKKGARTVCEFAGREKVNQLAALPNFSAWPVWQPYRRVAYLLRAGNRALVYRLIRLNGDFFGEPLLPRRLSLTTGPSDPNFNATREPDGSRVFQGPLLQRVTLDRLRQAEGSNEKCNLVNHFVLISLRFHTGSFCVCTQRVVRKIVTQIRHRQTFCRTIEH